MAIHVYHHNGDGWGAISGGVIVLLLIGWLFYVIPGWVWIVVILAFILGACVKK